jgi:hypothetical protein
MKLLTMQFSPPAYYLVLPIHPSIHPSTYGSTVFRWTLAIFSVSQSYTQLVGLLGRMISPSKGRNLPTQQHNTK